MAHTGGCPDNKVFAHDPKHFSVEMTCVIINGGWAYL